MVSNGFVHAATPPILLPILLQSTERWRPAAGCGVTVGNFDGVHVGHAAIVKRLIDTTSRRELPSAALTFDPHPATILRPEAAPPPLSTTERRAELLLALGVDAVFVQPTDERLTSLPPEAFFVQVLRERLGAVAIVEGSDFRFGSGRTGDVRLLADLCGRHGVALDVVDPVVRGDATVSSSRIRGLIASGRLVEANQLLTASYRIRGTVVPGARRGRSLGFPTANLSDIATVVPAEGVYAGRAGIAGLGTPHPAAIHIGSNATFGETRVSVEVHLIGFEGDLYGRRLDVDFLERLRETRRFDSPESLKAQLAIDVAASLKIAAA